jgi:hypothetical protein
MRFGYSWPLGGGRRAWVSGPLWLWVLWWLLLIVPLLAWWILKLALWLGAEIIALAREAHAAPAVPESLRSPPSRRPQAR